MAIFVKERTDMQENCEKIDDPDADNCVQDHTEKDQDKRIYSQQYRALCVCIGTLNSYITRLVRIGFIFL